jgi:hypothetical protein
LFAAALTGSVKHLCKYSASGKSSCCFGRFSTLSGRCPVVRDPFGDLKGRIFAALFLVFGLPVFLGLFIVFLVKVAPYLVIGAAVIAVAWLFRRLMQHYR